MDTFKDLIDKQLRKARPLSSGVGLFRPGAPKPTLHPTNLPEDPAWVRPATADHIDEATREFDASSEAVTAPDEFTSHVEEMATAVDTLKQKAARLEEKISSQPWMGQAMDLLVVWVAFLMFPLVTVLMFHGHGTRALFSPAVMFLFGAFYFFLLSAYLWWCHYLDVPTIGMRFQHMDDWPSHWRWNPTQLFPAVKRAFWHLLLDATWRKP